MDITNKMLADLAGQLGIDAGNEAATAGNSGSGANSGKGAQMNINDMKKIAEQYKDKSDAEILSEIAKVKDAIKRDRKTYEQQLKTVKALRPMMNAEQRARLDKIIEMLES